MSHVTGTLATLIEAAEAARDKAVARLAQARARLEAARHQAQQLTDYRQACQQRWGAEFRSGSPVTLLQCYQGFSSRMDAAVDLQGRQIERLNAELGQCQSESVAAEQRLAGYERLVQRREAEQRLKLAKREQKQLDEHAARQAWSQIHARDAGLPPVSYAEHGDHEPTAHAPWEAHAA